MELGGSGRNALKLPGFRQEDRGFRSQYFLHRDFSWQVWYTLSRWATAWRKDGTFLLACSVVSTAFNPISSNPTSKVTVKHCIGLSVAFPPVIMWVAFSKAFGLKSKLARPSHLSGDVAGCSVATVLISPACQYCALQRGSSLPTAIRSVEQTWTATTKIQKRFLANLKPAFKGMHGQSLARTEKVSRVQAILLEPGRLYFETKLVESPYMEHECPGAASGF